MEHNTKEKSIIRRFLDNLHTREEGLLLLDYIRRSKELTAWQEVAEEAWEESGDSPSETDVEYEKYRKEAHALLRKIEPSYRRQRIRRIAYTTLSVASMTILLFVAGFYLYTTPESAVAYAQATTTSGEKKNIVLPDGTSVTLNACSSLRYPKRFTGRERRIHLTGEAYIQAVRNESMPLIVSTTQLEVKVLGTRFDVKSYPEDEIIAVKVESGKVQVEFPDVMMRLTDSERICYNTTSGRVEKQKETNEETAGWRKGFLSFSHTPIRDVARDLERYYQCKITFTEGQSFDNLISGEHENANLEDVLKSIEYVSSVEYTYNRETKEVLFFKK